MSIKRSFNRTDTSFADLQAKSKFKRERAKPRQLESNIQKACIKWFRLQYPHLAGVLFAVPNGGSRNKIEAGRLKAEGVMAGVSDLVLLVPSSDAEFHGLCIEMKTKAKGSTQRKSQKTFQEAIEAQGYKYEICRDAEEFMNLMRGYLE